MAIKTMTTRRARRQSLVITLHEEYGADTASDIESFTGQMLGMYGSYVPKAPKGVRRDTLQEVHDIAASGNPWVDWGTVWEWC